MQADGLVSQMFSRARSDLARSLPSWWHTQPAPFCMWVPPGSLTSFILLMCSITPKKVGCFDSNSFVSDRVWVFIWVQCSYLWGSSRTSSMVRVCLVFCSSFPPLYSERGMVNCALCDALFCAHSGVIVICLEKRSLPCFVLKLCFVFQCCGRDLQPFLTPVFCQRSVSRTALTRTKR